MADTAPFTGFGPEALKFFTALDFHQTKAWFDENRKIYDTQVKAPMGALVVDLTTRFADAGIPLKGDPKKSLFRINRDVRFSNDKRPYKTNCGAVMTPDGTKKGSGLFYVHISPGSEGCFCAAGWYMPEKDDLAALRRRMARLPEAWLETEAALKDKGLALSTESTLSRPPKDFKDADDRVMPAIKLKSMTVHRNFPEEMIFGADLIDECVQFADDALPLLNFGWIALGTKIS